MLDSFYPPMSLEKLKAQWPYSQHSQFVQTPGVTWHVQRFGSGPPLLLLHGLGSSTHTWRGMAPRLAMHFSLIAVDIPGHAFSTLDNSASSDFDGMTRSLRQLLDALNIWPAAIVGHSAGACLAAKLILDADDFSPPALIALNPAWLPLPGLSHWLFPASAKLVALNPLSAWLFARHLSKEYVIEKILSGTGSKLSPDDVFYYRVLMQSPAHLKGVLRMMSHWDLGRLPSQLPLLKGRVLIQAGRLDKTIPFGHALTSHRKIPGSSLDQLPGLGHLAHEEDPQTCAQHILNWLLKGTIELDGG
jgi:magnesium chelatase accessory protein